MKAFYVAFLFVYGVSPSPFFVMLLLYLSSIHIFFFPFFSLHGDSLLHKRKYFLLALQLLALLVYMPVLPWLLCAWLISQETVVSSSICGSGIIKQAAI